MRVLLLVVFFFAGCGPLDEPFDAGQVLPARDAGSAKTPRQLCAAMCPVWGVLEESAAGSSCRCAAETLEQTMARCSRECAGSGGSSVTVLYAAPGAVGVCVCNG
jgi:hypothetical protein